MGSNVRIWFVALVASAACGSQGRAGFLTTTFASNNQQNGNMFDVVTLGGPLTVTALDLNMAGTATVEVWTRPGTWQGFENASTGWTLVSSNLGVAGAGLNIATPVDVTDFVLPGLSTTALYVTTTNATLYYTNGTAVGNVAAANSDLQILQGAGKAYPFSGTFTPRIWNGTIFYDQAGPPVTATPLPPSLALLVTGMVGLATLRRNRRAVRKS